MYQDVSACAPKYPQARGGRPVSRIRYISAHGRKPSFGSRSSLSPAEQYATFPANVDNSACYPKHYSTVSPESCASSECRTDLSPLFSDADTAATRTTRSSRVPLQPFRMPDQVPDKQKHALSMDASSTFAIREGAGPSSARVSSPVRPRSMSAPQYEAELDMSNWVHISSSTPVGLGVKLEGTVGAPPFVYSDADRASGFDRIDPDEIRAYSSTTRHAEHTQSIYNKDCSQEAQETTTLRPLSLVSKYFQPTECDWRHSTPVPEGTHSVQLRRRSVSSPLYSPIASDDFYDDEISGRVSPGEIHGLHIAVPEPSASLTRANGLGTSMGARRLRQLQLPQICGMDSGDQSDALEQEELPRPTHQRTGSRFRRVPFAVLHPRIPRAAPSDENRSLYWSGFTGTPWYWLIGGWCKAEDGVLLAPWSTPTFSSFRQGLHPYGPPFSLSRPALRPRLSNLEHSTLDRAVRDVPEPDEIDPATFGPDHKGARFFVQQRRYQQSIPITQLRSWAHVERFVLYNRVAAGLSSFFIFVCWSAGIWTIVSHF